MAPRKKFTIEKYLEAKELGMPHTGQGGCSAATLIAYGKALRRAERNIGKPLAEMGEDDVEHLLRTTQDLSPATRNQMLVALRQAFDWGVATDRYRGKNPWSAVARVKEGERLPKAITPAAVEAIIAEVQAIGNERAAKRPQRLGEPIDYGAKYALILRLMATGGLRLGEALGLRVRDVANDGLRVVGKGNKQRYVPLRPDVLADLKAYVKDAAPERWIFVGESGPAVDAPMSPTTLYGYFDEAVRRVGLDPHQVTPHVLRHSFATLALAKTKRLEVVQDLLGHSSPTTTRIYAKVAPEDLQEEYKKIWD